MIISSGVEATVDIEHVCLDAEGKGEVACNDFLQNRLKFNNTSFHERIKKCKLKTFGDLNIKKVCKLKEGTVSVAAERSMFARFLVISRNRGVSMKEIMKD